MKKVLVIAPYAYLPYKTGGQKSIALFLDYLGHETKLTVISVKNNDFSLVHSYSGKPLLIHSFLRYLDLRLIYQVIRIIKKERFDAVLWEHPYYAWLAWFVKKFTGIPTLLHIHNIESERFRSLSKWWWPVLREYEKFFFRFADSLFFVSESDLQYAVEKWKIPEHKCHETPFGITVKAYPENRLYYKNKLKEKHQLGEKEKILLFTGALNYLPNREALEMILKKINPLLKQSISLSYKIIICGGGLPPAMQDELKTSADQVIYAGFVPVIEDYYKGCDVLLNPVLSGGGVKTKVIEAIAYGANVVSTYSGAVGIDKKVCGEKLKIVEDGDWEGFARLLTNEETFIPDVTPPAFYEKYNWEKIVKQVADRINVVFGM